MHEINSAREQIADLGRGKKKLDYSNYGHSEPPEFPLRMSVIVKNTNDVDCIMVFSNASLMHSTYTRELSSACIHYDTDEHMPHS